MTWAMVGALACGAVSMWAAVDALTQVLTRTAVAGRVVSSSYSEADRLASAATHPWDWLYKVTAGNAKPVVRDVLTIEYHVERRCYRRQIETAHLRGDRADRFPIVWYDPSKPEIMTIEGPGGSTLVACIGLALMFSLLGWLPA